MTAPTAKRHAAEPAAPARVLSVHAHPDDQEFTVGGTLAKWARAGSHIVTVCITSGGAASVEYRPARRKPAGLPSRCARDKSRGRRTDPGLHGGPRVPVG